jgi:uncharacterized cupin superfamily protein
MMTPNQPHIPYPLLKASTIAAMEEDRFVHPLNPKAIRHTRSLGQATGLHHIGVHLVRVPPGHDSTQYHMHQGEEEFIYIIAGCGLAEIGDDTVEIGPGDFMGFVPGRFPHNLINNSTDDLVYLVGGMNLDFDICDYPRVGQRLYRRHEQREYVKHDLSDDDLA